MPEGREDLQGLSPTQGGESEGLEPQAEESQGQNDELTGDESIRDLVERAYKEEQAKNISADGDPLETDGQTPEKTLEPGPEGQKPNKQDSKEEVRPEESWQFQPPPRLSAVEKEAFNKLPKKLKPAIARMFADHERTFTQGQTQLSRAYNEVRDIHEAVNPYYNSHPELAEMGYTRAGFIAGLVGAHAKLADPKTKDDAYLMLGKQIGFDFTKLSPNENGEIALQNRQNTQVQANPEFLALQQTVNQLRGFLQQDQETKFQGQVDSIKAQFQAVIDEKDQFGRYRFPDLHEEEFFLKAKPLVSALLETVPGLSYGDALKRAYLTLKGQGNFNELNQTGLPANNTQQRALSAAVSVRGRTASQASSMSMPDKLPDRTRDLAQMAYDDILSGRGG